MDGNDTVVAYKEFITHMNKAIAVGAAILVIGAVYFFNGVPALPVTDSADNTSGLRAEDNMVIVSEQRPGASVLAAQVLLAAPGFVVIHEDNAGSPGAILGTSALLVAGESSRITVLLSRPSKDGEKLHVMLHSDTDGSGTFSAATDAPVQSTSGGPITGWFDISSDSPENPAITL